MFAKEFRLPARVFFKNSKTVSNNFFVLKVMQNNLPNNRYGFVVSKKIDKRSTVRNRTKRIIRSCFENLHPQLKPGYDVLVLAKKQDLEISFQEVMSVVKTSLQQVDLL